MAPVFQSADLLVIISKTEGIPLVALEAMASARPVVALNAGAVGEVVDETTGVLVSNATNEAAEMAQAIAKLLADPVRREQLGAQGRRRVESEYDARRAAAAYRELFI
jgi:glycosyltransferase involved in cell wall biosynthesis